MPFLMKMKAIQNYNNHFLSTKDGVIPSIDYSSNLNQHLATYIAEVDNEEENEEEKTKLRE